MTLSRLYYLFPVNDKSIPTCNIRISWPKTAHLSRTSDSLATLFYALLADTHTVPETGVEGLMKFWPTVLTDYLRVWDRQVAYISFASEQTAIAMKQAIEAATLDDAKLAVEYCGCTYLDDALRTAYVASPTFEHTVIVGHTGEIGAQPAALSISIASPTDSTSPTAAAGKQRKSQVGSQTCAIVSQPIIETFILQVASPREAKLQVVGPAVVPGLMLVHDFLTEEQERELLGYIDTKTWTRTLVRAVQHYGHGFDYISRSVHTANEDIPDEAKTVIDEKRVPRIFAVPETGPLSDLTKCISSFGLVGDFGDPRVAQSYLDRPLHGQAELRSVLPRDSSRAFQAVNQITVNEYLPGHGISGHIDTHESFEDGVVSLSLGGAVVMEFVYAAKEERRPPPGTNACAVLNPELKQNFTINKSYVVLPPRSLLIMRGEGRYAWTHTIPARRTDFVDGLIRSRPPRRVSVTLRVVREATPLHPRGDLAVCPCSWKSVCKSQNVENELTSPHLQKLVKRSSSEEEKGEERRKTVAAPAPVPCLAAPDVEKRHVHDLYNAIAPHFSSTRYAPWPAVEIFLNDLPAGSLVLDIGCGNGKYMQVNKALTTIGSDTSLGLLSICAEKGYNIAVADGVRLPFKTEIADAVLNIAVMHHISTLDRRLALIRELFRIAKPQATIFIQAWAFEQGPDSRRTFDKQDVFVPWNLQSRFIQPSASAGTDSSGTEAVMDPLVAAGGEIDATKGMVVFQRYCHMYKEGELEGLVKQLGIPAEVIRVWWEKDNWCLLVKKG
jgi:alkylated DNA repair protein alkB family protein 8